jgi:Integrase core domain
MLQLPSWIAHYNEVHPHKALEYRSPVSSSQLTKDPDRVRSFGGYNNYHRIGAFVFCEGIGSVVMLLSR